MSVLVSSDEVFDIECGICKTKGKNKETKTFCQDCKEYLCRSCTETHGQFPALRKHKMTSVEDPVTTSKSKTKPTTDSSTSQHGIINILRYKTIKKTKEINMVLSKNRSIAACFFMSRGELIECDLNNAEIKLLDRSLSEVNSLDLFGNPQDVAEVDNSNVIVTLPHILQLQFIQVLPSLKRGRTINVGEWCSGVDVAAGKIFVSCLNIDDNIWSIRVFGIDGKDLGKKLGINPDGSSMFSRPRNVAVSRSGDKIFVSDWDTNTVSCLTSDGNLLYQYRDMELKEPEGLLVDDNDNVIVCGWYSKTVQVITSAGRKHKTLLSSEDGISHLNCVSFRPSDGTLFVGCRWRISLVFRSA